MATRQDAVSLDQREPDVKQFQRLTAEVGGRAFAWTSRLSRSASLRVAEAHRLSLRRNCDRRARRSASGAEFSTNATNQSKVV